MALNALRDPSDATSPRNSRSTFESLGIVAQYYRGESVYRRNDPTEHWYRVIRGAARKSVVTADGRRYIIDFILPGDLFGIGESGLRSFNVEAIVAGTLVARYPRVSVERLIDSEPEFARRVRESAFDSMFRMQQRIVTLGRSAVERVSTFLLELSDRGDRGRSHVVHLPMSRYDIADYLAIAVETVSRTLTELKARRIISLEGVREVHILDRQALEGVADSLAISIRRTSRSNKSSGCRAPQQAEWPPSIGA